MWLEYSYRNRKAFGYALFAAHAKMRRKIRLNHQADFGQA